MESDPLLRCGALKQRGSLILYGALTLSDSLIVTGALGPAGSLRPYGMLIGNWLALKSWRSRQGWLALLIWYSHPIWLILRVMMHSLWFHSDLLVFSSGMARFHHLMLSWPLAHSSRLMLSCLSGSLISSGALPANGSLSFRGALATIGSLFCCGALNGDGSLANHEYWLALLVMVGSALVARSRGLAILNPVGSLATFSNSHSGWLAHN